MKEAGITPEDLDYVGFYEKPLTEIRTAGRNLCSPSRRRGFRRYLKAIPLWLNSKLHLSGEIDAALGHHYRGRYVFADHHESHAASAFFPSPFEEAAILTLDGVGEWSTTRSGSVGATGSTLTHELRFPHSLGLLYSAFTVLHRVPVNSGEYKVMGLAPYGEPRYRDLILQNLIDVKDDGSFRHGHVLLQLLPGPDHDERAGSTGSSAARRASPNRPAHRPRDGPGRHDPGGARRSMLRIARHLQQDHRHEAARAWQAASR